MRHKLHTGCVFKALALTFLREKCYRVHLLIRDPNVSKHMRKFTRIIKTKAVKFVS